MISLLEALAPGSIDLQSFEVQDMLNPYIWDEADQLRPEIRQHLMSIASEFEESLGIPVKVVDIIFTGSLANFNWSQYSDIDLHLVLDFGDIDENEELVSELMIAKKNVWNELHKIKIKGAEVELYGQDKDAPHEASGVYSILNDEWNVKPSRTEPKVDMGRVHEKATDMMDQIDNALDNPDCPTSCLQTLQDKIKRMRQSGLDKGGEFSVENLAFKVLRRNGYLELLWDRSVESTDQALSLQEAFLDEAPIRDLERVGDWKGGGSFRKKDQKLLTNPKAIEKIRKQWEQTPYTFDIYLLNIPELNKEEYKEYGELIPGSEVNIIIKDGLGREVPRSDDGITILFNGNYGTEKVPMTGWIMAHRLGHAIRVRNREAWGRYTTEVQYVFREVLRLYRGLEDTIRSVNGSGGFGDWEKQRSDEKKMKYIAQALGSMRSARQGKLVNFYEFYHELLAQWITTGSITFRPLERSIVIGKREWGHEDRAYAQAEDWLEEMNEMLPGMARGVEDKLNHMFNGLVGKTFLM